MAKKKTDKNSRAYKIKKSIRKKAGKFALIVVVMSAVFCAILKLIDFIKSGRSDKENPKREYKEFFNFLGAKKFKIDDHDISGIIVHNILGATCIDLSEATFKEDAFISLSTFASAVTITVPEGINVRFDGLVNKTAVENYAETADASAPTVYVASKCNFSAVRISRQE